MKQAFGIDDAEFKESDSEVDYTEERLIGDSDINELIDDMLKRHRIDKKKLYTQKGEGRPYNLADFKRIYAIEMARAPEQFGNTADRNSLVDEKVKTF